MILVPLPARDFDPIEVAVPWKILTEMGHSIVFATPDGRPGAADALMLDGRGLDPWGRIPGLRNVRFLGFILRGNADARGAYAEMTSGDAFQRTRRWQDLDGNSFDALVLPGGHRARGMREYLKSQALKQLTAAFVVADKPVGAICHGVLLAARSRTSSGRSVLFGRKTTSLTWRQERTAERLACVGRWCDPSYYRTYQEALSQLDGFMSVGQKVTRALADPREFIDVPEGVVDHKRKTLGLCRDSATDTRASWVVTDGRYVSARWPGDAHAFARTLGALVTASEA
ncbi:type 1 glutamine amidotransferase domain-containing protein [Sphingomonas sp. GB1N7]|uniref:type 1 glutamine amidotransferase domain-containing protein n=1 Tax=Parasphingomonas caseinilytica TaxID=3096158 RepID=UPI002FCBC33F